MKPHRLACALGIVGLLCAPGAVGVQLAAPEKAEGAGMLPPTIPVERQALLARKDPLSRFQALIDLLEAKLTPPQ